MERNPENLLFTYESQIEYLKNLTPDERRAYVMKSRDEDLKRENRRKIGFTLIGCLCFAGTFYVWLNTYGVSLMSSLGILTGIALGIIGSRYLGKIFYSPDRKFSADNFTDTEFLAYLEELKRNGKQEYAWWISTGTNIIIAVTIVLIVLVYIPQTNIFTLMMISSGLSAFLIGVALYLKNKTEKP